MSVEPASHHEAVSFSFPMKTSREYVETGTEDEEEDEDEDEDEGEEEDEGEDGEEEEDEATAGKEEDDEEEEASKGREGAPVESWPRKKSGGYVRVQRKKGGRFERRLLKS